MTTSNPSRHTFLLLGDSITQDGANPDITGWASLLQHSYVRSADIINRGHSGYNTRWTLKHVLPVLEGKELLASSPYAPSLVVIWLGANDAARPESSESFQNVPLEEFKSNLQKIVRRIQLCLPSAKILLLTPSAVIDEKRRLEHPDEIDRCNAVTKEYAEACVSAGQETNVPVLNLFTFFNKMEAKERSDHFRDGLHLVSSGNRLVFEQLKAKIDQEFPDLSSDSLAWQFPGFRDFK